MEVSVTSGKDYCPFGRARCTDVGLSDREKQRRSHAGYEVRGGNEFAAINRLHIAFARRLRKAALFTVAGRPAARDGGRARRGWQNEPFSGPMHRCIWMSCRRSSLVWNWAAMGKQGLAYPLQFHRRSGAMYAESSHFLRTV